MKLLVNGKEETFDCIQTVADLLQAKGLDPRSVVVELNEVIIRKTQVQDTPLKENDALEILRFVGGG